MPADDEQEDYADDAKDDDHSVKAVVVLFLGHDFITLLLSCTDLVDTVFVEDRAVGDRAQVTGRLFTLATRPQNHYDDDCTCSILCTSAFAGATTAPGPTRLC